MASSDDRPPSSHTLTASDGAGRECPSVGALEESLAAILDESTGPAEHVRSLREHVAGCPVCRERVRSMRSANEFVGRFAHAQSAATEALPTHPDTFAGYRLGEIIAIGGQGAVHRAEQRSTGRIVAIKIPLGDSARRPAKRYRFRREVELTARLRHPAIVDVLGVCESTDGRIGCVMEFVEGEPFDVWATARRSEGKPGVRAIVTAMREIADAIAHAHRHAVLHRDLKPSNVIVDADGRPRVLDFGLAKALDDDSASFATMTGAFLGTLAYAAPEQVREGRDSVDVRSDVHGLGLLLYTALTGGLPWNASAPTDILLRAIRESAPERPTRRLSSPDGELDAIVLKALAKERSRRYQSASELADDLGRWLDGAPVRARFDSRWYVVRKMLWRHRRLAIAATFAAASIVTVGWMSIETRLGRERESIERERGDAEARRAAAFLEVMRTVVPKGDMVFGDQFERQMAVALGEIGLRIETGAYALDPEYESELRVTVGALVASTPVMAGNGELWVRNALFARMGRHGEDHPEVATGYHHLAEVLLTRGRPAEAERAASAAIDIRHRHHGPRHATAAASHELRARARVALGKFDGAADDLAATKRSADLPAVVRVGLGRTTAELALAHGDAESAWDAAIDSVGVALAELPDDHPLTQGALVVAGRAAAAQHGPPTALAAALALPLAATDWSTLASRLDDVAGWLAGRHRFDGGSTSPPQRAEQSFDPSPGLTAAASLPGSVALARLTAIRTTLLGPTHPAVAVGLVRLAYEHSVEGDHAAAAAAFERALPMLRERLGANHLAVGNAQTRLATSLANAGRFVEAAEKTRNAIAVLESQPVRDEQTIAIAYGYIVRYELYAGLDSQALETGREAMRRIGRAMGETHYAHALAALHTAWALAALGRIDEAEPLADSAWATVLGAAAMPVDQRVCAEAVYGVVLCQAERHAAGQAHLRGALEVLFPIHDDGRLDRLVDALVASHRHCGSDAAVEEFLRSRADTSARRSRPEAIFSIEPSGRDGSP